MARGDMNAATISDLLADRIESLAAQLLPAGILVQRRLWRVGSLAGESGQSLCVYLDGPRRGRWHDFASGEGGDALDLVKAIVIGRDDTMAALKWARDWLGLGAVDEATRQRLELRAQRRREELQREAERDQVNRERDAKRLWLGSRPSQKSDPIQRYASGRGIHLDRWPRALRFHPALWNSESGRSWPAIVAAIVHPNGAFAAVHRTWLEVLNPGNLACLDPPRVTKAPLKEPKLTLGSYRGGCIRLWRGWSNKPWAQMPDGETLMLGEGIEDTLSGIMHWPQYRAACAVSLSAMLYIELPEAITEIRLLQQNDAKGSPAAKLVKRVKARFRAQGRTVIPGVPPIYVKDLNDYINHPSITGAKG